MSDTRLINYPLNPPMSAKRGVEIEHLGLPLRTMLVPMSYIWTAFFSYREDPDGMTLTSTYEGYPGDGVHGKNSLHYKGLAIDIRTKDVALSRIAGFITALKARLGADYDVVNEGDHIHIEYDPKRRPDTVVASEEVGAPAVASPASGPSTEGAG